MHSSATESDSDQQEALARLEFLLTRPSACAVVIGPHASGKSALLRLFAPRCRRRGISTALIPAASGRRDALFELAGQWGLAPDESQTDCELWRLVADRMTEHRYELRRGIVLLDDVHLAKADLFELALQLLSCAEAVGSPLTLAIVTPASELPRISADLLARVDLRIELDPPRAGEAASPPEPENVRDSIVFVSPGKLPELDPAAVARLHELAEALPRGSDHHPELTLRFGAGPG